MFYAQVQKLCKKRGEKLTPLCKKLGLSTGGVGRWQNGVMPNGETLIKFAEYFGVSTDYLLGLSEQINNFTLIKTEDYKMSEMNIKVKDALNEIFLANLCSNGKKG